MFPARQTVYSGLLGGWMGTFASNLKGKRRYLEGSTPERNVLILGGDERTLRIINSTTALEGKAERSIENQNLSSASSHRYRSATTCRGRTMGLQPGQRSVLFIYQRASATILWLSSVCNDVEDVELGCESVHRVHVGVLTLGGSLEVALLAASSVYTRATLVVKRPWGEILPKSRPS